METLIMIYYDTEIKAVILKTENTTVVSDKYYMFTGTPDNCLAVANLFNLGNMEMLTDFIENLNNQEDEGTI